MTTQTSSDSYRSPRTVYIYVEGIGTLTFDDAVINCFDLSQDRLGQELFCIDGPIIKLDNMGKIVCDLQLRSPRCMFAPDKEEEVEDENGDSIDSFLKGGV